MAQPTIHALDDAAWKRASPHYRAQWLRNRIAFAEAHGDTDSYWLQQYRHRLAYYVLTVTGIPDPDGRVGSLAGDPVKS